MSKVTGSLLCETLDSFTAPWLTSIPYLSVTGNFIFLKAFLNFDPSFLLVSQ